MSFWESFSLIWSAFILFAYLLVMFTIVTDLFRDAEVGGAAKAVWIVLLIVAPVIAAVVYLVVRGRGMSDRTTQAHQAAHDETEALIRQAAGGTSPAEQIATGHDLLTKHAITAEEFDLLKSRALA